MRRASRILTALAALLASPATLAQNQQATNNDAANGQFVDEQFGGDDEASANQQNAANQQNSANQQNAANQQNSANQQNNAQGNFDQQASDDEAQGQQGNFSQQASGNDVPANFTPPGNQAGPINQAAPMNQTFPTNQATSTNGLPPLNQAAPPVNQAASPQPAPAPAQPAAPSEPCKPKCEMRFQFDQSGTPGLHSFLLHWDFADGNLQWVEVLVADTQEVIQKITIPQDKVRLIYKELAEGPSRVKDKFVDAEDYNFDRSPDLRILQQWPYKVGAKYSFVWLFDEPSNQYVLNEAISALQNPRPNKKTRRLDSVELGGWGGGEYVQRSYAVNASGRLRVMARVRQTILDPSRLWFNRDVRIRINGDLQRICKIVVPSEGKARRTWGNKRLCRKYLTKETPRK